MCHWSVTLRGLASFESFVGGGTLTEPGHVGAKMLITVKTYPAPSTRHVETVCVAGVRLDTPEPEWVRLYPIPFRKMAYNGQFRKYQVVDGDIRHRGTHDPRPESHSPHLDSIRLGDVVKSNDKWRRRTLMLGGLVGATTTCELIRINRATTMDQPAPSLGLIKPEILDIRVMPGRPWTAKQLQKVKAAAEPDLFDTPLNELQPAPFQVKYRYRCESSGCRTHLQSVLDWELGAAGLDWQNRYGDRTQNMIEEQWTKIVGPEKDVHFFVGNQHQYRQAFSVLGVWYPPKA